MRRSSLIIILFAGYALLLVIAALALPLRIPEILQIAGSRHFEGFTLTSWIAQSPDSAPLNYFVQLPFLLAFGYTRLGARFDSLIFALAACYVFLRLARRIPLERPVVALLLFMLLPVHLLLANEGRPFEQGLFLLLLATETYLRLIERPVIGTAALYAALLTLCIYTERYTYLPALGYLLFLVRFVNRAQQRRAMWFALPATVLPALLFLPYYFWASPQENPYWLEAPPLLSDASIYLHVLRQLAGNEWVGCVLLPLLAAGTLAGAWRSFRAPAIPISKRIVLFCLFGGVVSTLAISAIADVWLGESFAPGQVLWAASGIAILVVSALEWSGKRQFLRATAPVMAALLLLICAAGDGLYLGGPFEDVQTEAARVAPELTSNSCVVFVSQRFSKVLFVLFAPELANRECLNFFHKRIVLASHPYVRPEQQADAESFFRGLNFSETKRIRSGGGQIVIMQLAQ